jgi:hypothetical protein
VTNSRADSRRGQCSAGAGDKVEFLGETEMSARRVEAGRFRSPEATSREDPGKGVEIQAGPIDSG